MGWGDGGEARATVSVSRETFSLKLMVEDTGNTGRTKAPRQNCVFPISGTGCCGCHRNSERERREED